MTRRDLMPGHVHTLGILRHSRSRHDRHNLDTFGEDQETATMAANPTGDPLLDARMVEEEEEMARKRKHYSNTEDEYAGLMSQKDKQWIINIQLNQLKCDNPYVDDYYFTIYQARKEEQKHRDDNRAGKELLLNESVVDLNTSYTPAQFENSLGKLQCVTVKAPRQIIDVGVVRVPEAPRATDSPVTGEAESPGLVSVTLDRKPAGEYKLLLMKIEVLFRPPTMTSVSSTPPAMILASSSPPAAASRTSPASQASCSPVPASPLSWSPSPTSPAAPSASSGSSGQPRDEVGRAHVGKLLTRAHKQLLLQMSDIQLPGELAHALHLEALGPSYYTMMYVARHLPLTEELPDVDNINVEASASVALRSPTAPHRWQGGKRHP